VETIFSITPFPRISDRPGTGAAEPPAHGRSA
jgi:hypothetical protein